MEKIMDYVKAFVVGGLICVLVQILMEKTTCIFRWEETG